MPKRNTPKSKRDTLRQHAKRKRAGESVFRARASTTQRTKPELWERVKAEVLAGSHGGRPGQWSARKAQLAVQMYKARGGGYIGPKDSDNSLVRWTEQRWRTKSGRPSLETGERYLPEAAIEALSDAEYAETSRRKRAGMRKGQQFVPQPPHIADKVAPFRHNSSQEYEDDTVQIVIPYGPGEKPELIVTRSRQPTLRPLHQPLVLLSFLQLDLQQPFEALSYIEDRLQAGRPLRRQQVLVVAMTNTIPPTEDEEAFQATFPVPGFHPRDMVIVSPIEFYWYEFAEDVRKHVPTLQWLSPAVLKQLNEDVQALRALRTVENWSRVWGYADYVPTSRRVTTRVETRKQLSAWSGKYIPF